MAKKNPLQVSFEIKRVDIWFYDEREIAYDAWIMGGYPAWM